MASAVMHSSWRTSSMMLGWAPDSIDNWVALCSLDHKRCSIEAPLNPPELDGVRPGGECGCR